MGPKCKDCQPQIYSLVIAAPSPARGEMNNQYSVNFSQKNAKWIHQRLRSQNFGWVPQPGCVLRERNYMEWATSQDQGVIVSVILSKCSFGISHEFLSNSRRERYVNGRRILLVGCCWSSGIIRDGPPRAHHPRLDARWRSSPPVWLPRGRWRHPTHEYNEHFRDFDVRFSFFIRFSFKMKLSKSLKRMLRITNLIQQARWIVWLPVSELAI